MIWNQSEGFITLSDLVKRVADYCPRLELVFQPVLFVATERVGVKDIE